MAILTMGGSITDEVEAALNLGAPVDTADPKGAMIDLVVKAAEAFVKIECRRNFELIAITDQAFDIQPGDRDILLRDRPVTDLVSIGQVINRLDDGSVIISDYNPGEYLLDADSGIVSLITGGYFPAGLQSVLVSYEAGYTPQEIQSNAANEILVLKQLCLSIIQNWFKKRLDQIGHMASVSFGAESVTITFDLTGDEKRLLNQLKL
jgi:hypothetical protein